MPVLLQLAYDGTDLHGCGPVDGGRSVLGELAAALGRLGVEADLDACSRTDAGVHATAQVVVVQTERRWTDGGWLRALDRHLPPDVRCVAVAQVDALPSVASKTYAYRLDLTPWGDPAQARFRWRVGVDPDRVAALAPLLVGTHDLAAFRRRGETRTDLVRTITAAEVGRDAAGLELRVTGTGFAFRSVRSLVGAVLATARGACTEADLHAALGGRPSPAADHQAPARGLHLVAIELDPRPPWTCTA